MKLGVFWRHLGNPGVYYPRLAKVTGGVTASIFSFQLFHWQSQLSNPNQWVRTTLDEIENETGLNRLEQELARNQLVKRSLLKERVVGNHRDTFEFWLDINALEERLNELLSLNTRDEIHSGESSSSHVTSIKSQVNLDSQMKNETLVEILETKETDKSHFINNENGSEARQYISSPETSPVPVDSSGISTPVEVVDNAQSLTRTIKTDKFFPVRRQPLAVKVTPNYQFSGPWKSNEQFEDFQRTLLDYAKNQGMNNPSTWVFYIVDGISKGLISPFWDEFISGIPLGKSQKVKRDWEIEPGVPYPAFEEERTQYYVHKGEPIEEALAKARADLRNPVLGKDLWEGFLRKCDRMANEALKAKQLGVSTPYLPPSFTDKPQITKESVIEKLSAIAPQSSLSISSDNSTKKLSLEQQKVEDNQPKPSCDAPPLSALQQAYKTPMGRTLVKKQIAEHPEWGYGIVDGQVVDLLPF